MKKGYCTPLRPAMANGLSRCVVMHVSVTPTVPPIKTSHFWTVLPHSQPLPSAEIHQDHISTGVGRQGSNREIHQRKRVPIETEQAKINGQGACTKHHSSLGLA